MDEKEEQSASLQRPCTQEEFDVAYKYKRRKSTTLPQTFIRHYSSLSAVSIFLSLFPVFKWLPNYKFKKDLTSDLASGFTVAVMHVPQGMAYASLAAVNPIVGIYMAMFPVFVYFMMGTSRHISLGSFSIVCLMAAKPVVMYSTVSNLTKDSEGESHTYTRVQVASIVCFTVGLIHVILGICKIGSLSMFMSESLVSGFTTGAAVLVFTSQLEHCFGVQIKRHFGIFHVIHTYSELAKNLPKTNYLALIISLCVIVVLCLYTDIIQPRVKCRFTMPMEFIVLIISTLVSYCFDLKDQYSIHIVGSIPTGLPKPSVPPMELIQPILVPCIVIAIVSFSINISMASMFSMKDNYKIDPNQELLACGFGNIFGGFFSCLPMAVSLSRSMIQYTTGGKTQLASIFSFIFLLSILLYLGKFLETLPYCVLAGIVIKSLKSMLLQIKDLPTIWNHSAIDGIIWILTFLSVILLDIDIGLGIALVLSLLSIIVMNQKAYVCLLGQVPNSEIYLDLDRYPSAKPIPNFIIVQIHAGLYFANIQAARNKIIRLVNGISDDVELSKNYTLVLDLTGVNFIDPAALHTLNNLIKNFERKGITVLLSNCTAQVYEQMRKCEFFQEISEKALFPTIHDAVYYTLKQNNRNNISE